MKVKVRATPSCDNGCIASELPRPCYARVLTDTDHFYHDEIVFVSAGGFVLSLQNGTSWILVGPGGPLFKRISDCVITIEVTA